jgi:hypothetical protein
VLSTFGGSANSAWKPALILGEVAACLVSGPRASGSRVSTSDVPTWVAIAGAWTRGGIGVDLAVSVNFSRTPAWAGRAPLVETSGSSDRSSSPCFDGSAGVDWRLNPLRRTELLEPSPESFIPKKKQHSEPDLLFCTQE